MRKTKRPPAVPAADGAERKNAESAAIIAPTAAAANSSLTIIRIRRAAMGGKVEWLVSISGICTGAPVVCTDVPVSDRRLRSARRFSNVIWSRFGARFVPMPPDWLSMVEAAIVQAGAP